MIRYQAKIFKDGNGYSVVFPDLPGCFSQGKTRNSARENAREALGLYLEEARDFRWSVPVPKRRGGKQYEWISAPPEVAIPLMIRTARMDRGLSQTQLAQRLGMSVQQLQKLETPGKCNPTVKTLYAISKALDGDMEIELLAQW